MSCRIYAREGQYLVVTDIQGVFLHAEMEQEVQMLLEGNIAKLV